MGAAETSAAQKIDIFYFDFLAHKSELTMCVYDDSTECYWLYESLINVNTFKNIKKVKELLIQSQVNIGNWLKNLILVRRIL